MKHKLTRTVISILLTAACIISTIAVSPQKAQAKAYGTGLKLNNDIKLNKTKTYQKTGVYKEATFFPKAQKIKVNYTISSKRKSVGKNYKVTYKVKYSYLGNPALSNADQIYYDDWWWGYTQPWPFYTVFDYQTGMSLEVKNELNVKVKGSKWKYTWYPKQYYKYTGNLENEYDEKDCWIRNYKTIRYSFTVTYPKTCKDVVVGIGFTNRADVPSGDSTYDKYPDNRYWTGKKTPYGKTSFYKKGKKTMSYMRLNK